MTKIEDLTHRALGFYVERQNVLLANMGNRDTPGYTPVDLKFHQTLRDMVNGVPLERTYGCLMMDQESYLVIKA